MRARLRVRSVSDRPKLFSFACACWPMQHRLKIMCRERQMQRAECVGKRSVIKEHCICPDCGSLKGMPGSGNISWGWHRWHLGCQTCIQVLHLPAGASRPKCVICMVAWSSIRWDMLCCALGGSTDTDLGVFGKGSGLGEVRCSLKVPLSIALLRFVDFIGPSSEYGAHKVLAYWLGSDTGGS